MLRSPDALAAFIRTDPLCRRLADLATAADTPLVLVGGCIRDWLLDRPALDWDVIVVGDPAPVLAAAKRVFGRYAATLDESFGVYRLVLPEGPTIDFTRMQGTTVLGDLARRDLTMNALGCSLVDGALLDPSGGLADLQARRVRAVSRQNLVDDPLRLLRVFRFAATLPGVIDEGTLSWVSELAPAIETSATERVWAELGKLLGAAGAADMIAAMQQSGLLAHLLPEVVFDAPARAARLREGILTLAIMGITGQRAVAELGRPLTGDRPRIAALYVAALACAKPGALDPLAERLHWSKREIVWSRRVLEGLRAFQALSGDSEPERSRYRLIKAAQDAIPGLAALVLAADPLSRETVQAWLGAYFHQIDYPAPKLLDGHDLMRELGLAPGPQLAVLLSGIEEAQAMGEVSDRPSALAWVADQVRE